MSNLIPHQQSAVSQVLQSSDMLGRPKVSRNTVRRLRFELEEALVAQVKIERAKQAAVAGMLAEDHTRRLAAALCANNPAAQMAADEYIQAIHAVGIAQVLKAAN